jgi:glycosyltransferase involved in cell wall biosynthesis
MARICLVTTSQPSANPRLVKEADALVEAGHVVHVVGAHWVDWATTADALLVASRGWTFSFVDWRRNVRPTLWWMSRVRQHAARRACQIVGPISGLAEPALTRLAPELGREVRRHASDLYIAHNLGALPVAIDAARGTGARVGFDAEDFHSGQLTPDRDGPLLALTQAIERRSLPKCDYVTAAAPLIADAYAALCGIATPDVVLNVFSRRHRPALPRPRREGPVRLYWFSQTIGPDRGLEDAVAALALLRRPDVELHLRGRWQEGYEAQLRRVAADAGLAGNRMVVHAPAAPDEMVALAFDMDIGLALEPPVSFNNDILWSNKVFTYLLGGTPAVLSRTAGQSRLAPLLGEAAVMYTPGDVAGLAAALDRWTSDASALGHARAVAWQLGDERYNWEIEQRQFLRIVDGVLDVRAAEAGHDAKALRPQQKAS